MLVSCSAEMPAAGEEAGAASLVEPPPEGGAAPAGGLDLTRWITCSWPIPVLLRKKKGSNEMLAYSERAGSGCKR